MQQTREKVINGILGVGISLVVLLMGGCISSTPPATHQLATSTPEPTDVPSTPTEAPPPTPTPTPSFEQTVLRELGPGWSIAAVEDINRHSTPAVIVAREARVSLSSSFDRPEYADYSLLASEVRIAQKSPDSSELHWILDIQPERVLSRGKLLLSLVTTPAAGPPAMPAAFLLKYTPHPDVQVVVIPLNQAGERYMQSLGFAWDEGTQSYRLRMAVDMPAGR